MSRFSKPVRYSSTAAYWAATHFVGLLHDVGSGNTRMAAVGADERREHAHGCRLTGTVRAKDTEHGALGNREADIGHRYGLAELLDEALGLHRVRHGCLRSSRRPGYERLPHGLRASSLLANAFG